MAVVALIPASGSATRMRGLPKFLLPNGTGNETLIEAHIRKLNPLVDEIRISINPIFEKIFLSASLELHNSKVEVMETLTMTETVIELAKFGGGEKFIVVMPDTAFLGEEPYAKLLNEESDLNLSVWKIRDTQKGKLGQVSLNQINSVLACIDKDPNCEFQYAWGMQMFTPRYLAFLEKQYPHIGYGIMPAILKGIDVKASIVNGSYWDCGTPEEYVEYLVKKKG